MLEGEGANPTDQENEAVHEDLFSWLCAYSDRLNEENSALEQEMLVYATQIETMRRNLEVLGVTLSASIAESYVQPLENVPWDPSSLQAQKIPGLDEEIKTKEERLAVLEAEMYVLQGKAGDIEQELKAVQAAILEQEGREFVHEMTPIVRRYFFGKIRDVKVFIQDGFNQDMQRESGQDLMTG
ncbi:hypothetical protein ACFL3C_03920 [Patescibacteria group bacterium]